MKLAISRRWAIFIITSLLFVLSQFYRSSIAVITPQLMSDVSIDTKGLSLMSAAFFYAFALTQIPIGIYLDRIGPRKTMTVLSLVAVIGALIFAWANSLEMFVLGRLMLGTGMACNLMGSFKLLTLWFGSLRFATLSAFILSLGTAGNIAATTPLVLLVKAVYWRPAFTIIAAVNLLLAIIFFWLCETGRVKHHDIRALRKALSICTRYFQISTASLQRKITGLSPLEHFVDTESMLLFKPSGQVPIS